MVGGWKKQNPASHLVKEKIIFREKLTKISLICLIILNSSLNRDFWVVASHAILRMESCLK